jgi:hypothetical protein
MILLYGRVPGGPGGRLQTAVEDLVRPHDLAVVHSTRMLDEHLRHACDAPCLAVFVTERRDELRELLSLSDLLEDVPVFLVVPDRSEETLQLAHRFHPRYIITPDEDASEFAAVLRKKIGAMQSSQQDFHGRPE